MRERRVGVDVRVDRGCEGDDAVADLDEQVREILVSLLVAFIDGRRVLLPLEARELQVRQFRRPQRRVFGPSR